MSRTTENANVAAAPVTVAPVTDTFSDLLARLNTERANISKLIVTHQSTVASIEEKITAATAAEREQLAALQKKIETKTAPFLPDLEAARARLDEASKNLAALAGGLGNNRAPRATSGGMTVPLTRCLAILASVHTVRDGSAEVFKRSDFTRAAASLYPDTCGNDCGGQGGNVNNAINAGLDGGYIALHSRGVYSIIKRK